MLVHTDSAPHQEVVVRRRQLDRTGCGDELDAFIANFTAKELIPIGLSFRCLGDWGPPCRNNSVYRQTALIPVGVNIAYRTRKIKWYRVEPIDPTWTMVAVEPSILRRIDVTLLQGLSAVRYISGNVDFMLRIRPSTRS